MFMLRRWALARNCGSFAMSARADSHFFVIASGVAAGNAPDGPTDDHTSSPGCAFTHAESSLNVFQGASALTAKTMGSRTIRAAYLRSASVSGGLFWAPISIDEIVWMSMSSV